MTAPLPLWRCVDLRRVHLIGCTVRSAVDPEALPPAPLLHLEYEATATQTEAPAQVVGLVRLKVRGVVGEAEQEQHELFELNVQYRVVYALTQPCAVDAAALDRFANENVVFNAWPYLRELVQSLYYRMELPLPPLPRFTVSEDAGGVAQPAEG
jgi:hypothetical protein